jgi:hypothetical protein
MFAPSINQGGYYLIPAQPAMLTLPTNSYHPNQREGFCFVRILNNVRYNVYPTSYFPAPPGLRRMEDVRYIPREQYIPPAISPVTTPSQKVNNAAFSPDLSFLGTPRTPVTSVTPVTPVPVRFAHYNPRVLNFN